MPRSTTCDLCIDSPECWDIYPCPYIKVNKDFEVEVTDPKTLPVPTSKSCNALKPYAITDHLDFSGCNYNSITDEANIKEFLLVLEPEGKIHYVDAWANRILFSTDDMTLFFFRNVECGEIYIDITVRNWVIHPSMIEAYAVKYFGAKTIKHTTVVRQARIEE